MKRIVQEEMEIDHHLSAVELVATLFPKEMGEWLLQQMIIGKRPKVLTASFVKDSTDKKAYLVPQKEVTTDVEDEIEKEFHQMMGQFMAKEFAKNVLNHVDDEDITVTPIVVDHAELRRQVLLQGGCPIQLAGLIEIDGKSFPTTIGVALPGPGDDGRSTPEYLYDRLGWQIESFENLFIEREVMPTPDYPQNYLPFLFSLYLWPGTGLYDVEEFYVMQPISIFNQDFLHRMDTTFEERNRLKDETILSIRRDKDRRRRESYERRRRLLEDPLMTEEELDSLYHTFDPQEESINFSLSYDSVRLWEIPIEELLEDLPTGCLGLALFGHKPLAFTTKEIVQQSIWSLRYRIKEEELDREEAMKATLALGAIASNWLNSETIFEMITRSNLFF